VRSLASATPLSRTTTRLTVARLQVSRQFSSRARRERSRMTSHSRVASRRRDRRIGHLAGGRANFACQPGRPSHCLRSLPSPPSVAVLNAQWFGGGIIRRPAVLVPAGTEMKIHDRRRGRLTWRRFSICCRHVGSRRIKRRSAFHIY